MKHEFVIFEKEVPQYVHVIGAGMGGEFTACGKAYDLYSEEDIGECLATEKNVVTCPDCIDAIKHFTSIRYTGTSDDAEYTNWQEIITNEGRDYRERERIKRKITRWLDNLREMSKLERRVFLTALQNEGFIDVQKVPESIPEEKKEIPVKEKFYLLRDLIAKHGGRSGTARIDRVRADYPYDDFDEIVMMAAKRYIVELVGGDPITMTNEEIDNCIKIGRFQYLNMLWHDTGGVW